MKAGILYGAYDIHVGQMLDPIIGPYDILLESHAAGICGTDLHIYRGEFENRVRYPAVQGHEFGGVIAEVGANRGNGGNFRRRQAWAFYPGCSMSQCQPWDDDHIRPAAVPIGNGEKVGCGLPHQYP